MRAFGDHRGVGRGSQLRSLQPSLLLSKAARVLEGAEAGEEREEGDGAKQHPQDVVRWFYFLSPGCAGRSPGPSKPHEISKGSGSF